MVVVSRLQSRLLALPVYQLRTPPAAISGYREAELYLRTRAQTLRLLSGIFLCVGSLIGGGLLIDGFASDAQFLPWGAGMLLGMLAGSLIAATSNSGAHACRRCGSTLLTLKHQEFIDGNLAASGYIYVCHHCCAYENCVLVDS